MNDQPSNPGNESVKGPDIVVDMKVSDKSIEEAKRKFEELHGDLEDDVHIETKLLGGDKPLSGPSVGSEVKLEGLEEVNANLSLIRESLDRLIEIQSETLTRIASIEEAQSG